MIYVRDFQKFSSCEVGILSKCVTLPSNARYGVSFVTRICTIEIALEETKFLRKI